jgi:hypothetical protein
MEIDSEELNLIVRQATESNLDFLQIGYLKLNIIDRIEVVLRNLYDYLIRLGFLNKFFMFFGFKESERMKNQSWRKTLPSSFIVNDIRYGAHAYIISSDFARSILQLKEPHFLAIDDLFVALGRMKSFRMARLRNSRSSQSDSESSVLVRYKQEPLK